MGPGINTIPSTSTSRQSTLGVPPAKKRQSAIGASSSHGRLYKVLADFFLLSGRTEDAALWYTEAIVLLKPAQDAIWHASALEGMATVTILDAWSTGHGLQTSFSTTKEAWNDTYEKLSQAISLYNKAPTQSEIGQNNPFLAYLYVTAVLRQASLLFCIWSAKGWGPLAWTSMLQPAASSFLQSVIADTAWAKLERLSTITGISRSQISTVLAQAHGPWLLHLGPRERLITLQSIASTYACLGYKRKEIYILREVLGCIMDLLVCGREENDEYQRSNIANSGLGIRGVDLGDQSPETQKGNVSIKMNETTDGNESILRLLTHICRVLGVDFEAVKLVKLDKSGSAVAEDDDSVEKSSLEQDSANPILEMFGWSELQIGVIREAIAVAEALPDYLAVARIALSSLKTMHPVLSIGDQYHLYQTATRALATARRRGSSETVEYWAGRPVISISVSPLPLSRRPIESPVSALAPKQPAIDRILAGATDPFLYNPRRMTSAMGKSMIVQNEVIEVTVTLQNPFIFEIELQSLSLSTRGVPFESHSVTGIIIPSNSYHHVTITGTALEAGALIVRGCIVQAPDGAPREFLLPLYSSEEEDKMARQSSALKGDLDRVKYSGLESRPWEKEAKRLSVTTAPSKRTVRFLECKVVPEQPQLRIRWTSLTHGAVMLYNGERSTIRLTLENVSSLPIDFLRLSFEDSTIALAQDALSEGEMSVFETYETEYELIHRQAFSANSNKDISTIKPGQKVVLTVTCLGKVGCTSGAIHISYSYVNRPQYDLQTPGGVIHTRLLTYPVTVTVYHMLECHDMNILPFDNTSASTPREDEQDDSIQSCKSLTEVPDKDDWCLLSVDVRNTYGLPFEVTFERVQGDVPRASVSSIVPPGSMTRIMIPIKKFKLPEAESSAAIPTLSERQFVVAKTNLTSEEERTQREMFWYREELLKVVRGRWKEANGTRSGELSLRRQRMTLTMLKTLRTETARVNLSLVQYETDDLLPRKIECKGGAYLPKPDEVIYLRIEVSNLASTSFTITINLHMDPHEHILFEGVLCDILLGKIESGECKTMEMPICFLCHGRFEICAEARILSVADASGRAGAGRIRAVVSESP
ncbi:hypothetical protein SERLA73DRAFT_111910 [Serpula lacrymans var. lacrymans S7.3]|uniref:Uncharacterized protein n=1 Tax=Serpula lacrymans var. lacrymans (strain S7.3) TaxID=936435 RepID=F8Q5R1_SERL3|nr:hypothetical protein SERLA73DRAFT_111910 [Serpula lacrymans var. lacrymans S7.3]